MRSLVRRVTWRGRSFRFQRMAGAPAAETVDWAVSSGFEFIGTMPCVSHVTTGEFDVQCLTWLAELMG